MPRRLLLSLSRIEWPAWNVQNWILKVRWTSPNTMWLGRTPQRSA
jgi:hypothetical protein